MRASVLVLSSLILAGSGIIAVGSSAESSDPGCSLVITPHEDQSWSGYVTERRNGHDRWVDAYTAETAPTLGWPVMRHGKVCTIWTRNTGR